MISLLILLLVFSSGSFWGSIYLGKKSGRFIPLTMMCIGIVLYVFGYCSLLRYGVYAVLLITILLYSTGVVRLVTKKQYKTFAHNFFTPSYLLFICIYAVAIYANYGRLVWANDEFSHWADVVKAMTYLDDFATNAESHSYFASYPPAMALLQYFSQKVYLLASFGEPVFSEWRLSLVFQLYSFSLVFPILEEKENTFDRILLLFSYIFAALMMYSDFLKFVCIDPFLGLMTGFCMSIIVFTIERDRIFDVTIALCCTTLALSKDVGMYFAFVCSVLYLAFSLIGGNRGKESSGLAVKRYMLFAIPLIASVVIKISWRMKLLQTGTYISFGQKINVLEYLKLYFFDADNLYSIVNDSKSAIYTYKTYFGLGGEITYFNLLILLIVLTLISYKIIDKRKVMDVKLFSVGAVAAIVQAILYASFIGAMYLYRMGEILSYDRYMNMSFLALVIFVISAVFKATSAYSSRVITLTVVCGIALATNALEFEDFLNRKTVRFSEEMRQNYVHMQENILLNCDPNSKIYFVSTNDFSGYQKLAMRFLVRPCDLDTSLGNVVPVDTTKDEWMDTLIDGNYDYVCIYVMEDYFRDQLGECFVGSDNIEDNTIYSVDKENRVCVLLGSQ